MPPQLPPLRRELPPCPHRSPPTRRSALRSRRRPALPRPASGSSHSPAHAALCGPASILLIALSAHHNVPSAPGPRHTRQVPTMTFDEQRRIEQPRRVDQRDVARRLCRTDRRRSRKVCRRTSSRRSCSAECSHPPRSTHTSASGFAGSIATAPPSPEASWVQAPRPSPQPQVVAAVPFAPSPTSSVDGSVGCCARLSTSASEPSPPFRFSKCAASSASTDRRLLIHAIGRAPQASIVADQDQRSPAGQRAPQSHVALEPPSPEPRIRSARWSYFAATRSPRPASSDRDPPFPQRPACLCLRPQRRARGCSHPGERNPAARLPRTAPRASCHPAAAQT